MDRPFDDFEDWRDEIWAQEDLARHKLDRKIKEEARWAVEGISARRKRNQGRVRELQKLRETRAEMIAREGRRGAVAGGRAQGRQAGDRGQGHLAQSTASGRSSRPSTCACCAATGWPSWGRTGRARPRFSTC
jgi:hypothetical protein